ncbi:MAG TPA: succinate dehydrogenase assembly factor 2 [Rhodocyclaceae bacterium]|jgi:antitoxin CptB|nr:succinate dehydrogenase assembly factor 2 [Rhodocyclaceae bacterium]
MTVTATTAQDQRARDERLRWHCRRALLELDIVFSRFWAEQGDAPLSSEDAASMERLLELEDHPLWDLVNGKTELPTEQDKNLLERWRKL